MRYLVVELFWAAIQAGCVSFNAAYLIRLGGSNLQVSLLTAGGALIVALTTLPFAALVQRSRNRRRLIVGSLALMRLIYGLQIVVPWLPFWRPEAMVAIMLLLNISASLFSAGWLPLLADMIPLERRGKIFAARNLTQGITVTIVTFLLGRWLNLITFPLNYQLLYLLGLITSQISTLYVARLVLPEPAEPADGAGARPTMAALFRELPKRRSFLNIIINTLIFTAPAWMAIPLQPIYFVRELGADEGWLGMWAGLVSAGAIAGNLIWSRTIERKGASWVLVRTAWLSTLYYLLIALFPNLTLILLFGLLIGMVTPGVELSHLNVLFQVCPADQRTIAMGLYIMLMNFGAFLTPLAVAPLIDLIGMRPTVLLLYGLRVAGALLFALNPVRVDAPSPATQTS